MKCFCVGANCHSSPRLLHQLKRHLSNLLFMKTAPAERRRLGGEDSSERRAATWM